MIRSRVLPALAVALLLAAAWTWWTQVRFPARTVRVAGVPQLTLHVQNGVRATDLAAIRRGLVAQQRYLAAIGSGGVAHHVDVRIADGDGCHAFERAGGSGVGQTEKGFVCLDLRAPAWAYQRAREPLGLADTPAHELVHARQAELGCLADGDAQRWRWLFEGTAIVLSYNAVEPSDAVRAATIRRFGAFARDVAPLQTYDTRNGLTTPTRSGISRSATSCAAPTARPPTFCASARERGPATSGARRSPARSGSTSRRSIARSRRRDRARVEALIGVMQCG